MNIRSQKGLSTESMLLIALVAIFAVTLFLKFFDFYYEDHLVRKGLQKLARDHPTDLAELSKSKIKGEMSKFYTLNGVRGKEVTEALDVDRKKETTLIIIAYEVRAPLFWNIDAVLKFNNVLDTSKPDECCSPPKE